MYRWSFAAFYVFSFINSIIFSIERNQLLVSLIYLTRWNLLATALTSISGAYFVTQYYNGKLKSTDRMSIGLKVYWFMSMNTVVFAFMISGIYWTMLYDGRVINLNNVLVHMTNSIVLIIDLLIIQHPCRISHFIYPMLCGSIYELFTIIYTFLGGIDKNGGNYVYPILNWKEKPLFSIIVGVTSVMFLGIMHICFCWLQFMRAKCATVINKEKYSENCHQTFNDVEK